MKTKWFAVIAAVNLLMGMSSRAQAVLNEGAGIRIEVDVPELPDRPERPEQPEKPERPERPDKGGLSQEMKDLVAEFRRKVGEFHSEQKELVKKLKKVTDEEREEIREQVKSNRDELKGLKEEFHDSVKELTGTLKDHVAKVAAETKAEGRRSRSRE